MIHFPATFEIFLCLFGAAAVTSVALWFTESALISAAVFIGVFCWLLDMMFSYEVEYEDDEDL